MDWLYDLVGELVSEVVAPAVLILIIVLVALPVYFIRRKVTGSKTTLREDLMSSVINTINATPQRQPPSPFIQELDQVRSGIETVYLFLLYGVIALVTGFIIYFFKTLRHDANRDFLTFYFGVGYLVFMLFAVGQVFALKSGRRRGRRASQRGAPRVTLSSGAGTGSGARAYDFSFQFGSAPAGGSGLEFQMGFSAPPVEEKLDNEALEKAESYLAIGENLESVCRFINPRFAGWSGPMQEAYKQCLRQALEARRSPQAEVLQPETAPDMQEAESPAPYTDTAKPAAAFTILGLSAAQLVVTVMVFVGALAGFLALMMLRSRMGR